MTAYKVGDIVSVEFPFSDLQNRKRRPGLVLVSGDDDLLLARFTTATAREASDITLSLWAEAGLPLASTVRLTKLARVVTLSEAKSLTTIEMLRCAQHDSPNRTFAHR